MISTAPQELFGILDMLRLNVHKCGGLVLVAPVLKWGGEGRPLFSPLWFLVEWWTYFTPPLSYQPLSAGLGPSSLLLGCRFYMEKGASKLELR